LRVARRQGKERAMPGTSGGVGFVSFILGGLVVIVAILAFMVYDDPGNKTVAIDLPKMAAPR
jgi:hypothetical protein